VDVPLFTHFAWDEHAGGGMDRFWRGIGDSEQVLNIHDFGFYFYYFTCYKTTDSKPPVN